MRELKIREILKVTTTGGNYMNAEKPVNWDSVGRIKPATNTHDYQGKKIEISKQAPPTVKQKQIGYQLVTEDQQDEKPVGKTRTHRYEKIESPLKNNFEEKDRQFDSSHTSPSQIERIQIETTNSNFRTVNL